jgi:hypothetical protein
MGKNRPASMATLPRRAAAVASAAVLAVTAAAPATAAEPPPPHVVEDPHYGDTLFHFWQDRYFTAITTLMASQHFGRVAHHADEAEVLRGGMLLSYGLHREAGEIFAQLIEKGASPKVRDRAWFYLAKIRYQRGYLAEAEEAVGRIGNNLPPDLEEERGLLRANILMARGDYAGAAGLLNTLAAAKTVTPYVRYNLGVALVKTGDIAGGSALLDQIGKTVPLPTEEQRSLRDKANVALGFAALQDDRPEAARGYLERVRLEGVQSSKALLGFGWAAAAMKMPRQALVPWMELATRDAADASVLEARIAVPYAYAELGAYGQSLQRYNEAIDGFERERVHLDESIAAIRAGKLVDGLLERNPGDEMGWFWSIRELPEMPHASHLAHVLAQHEFQEAFKNFRDLRFLARNLQDWADRLVVFGDMLANRRQAYAERLPKVLEQMKNSEQGLAALQKRRDVLAAELAAADAATDAAAFADPAQRELMARIDSVRDTLKSLEDDPQLAQAREKLRLAAGAMQWQLMQDYPGRLWTARKGLAVADGQLAQAHRAEDALVQAQRDEPARFEQFAARIAALEQRIRALIPQVAALSSEQQGQVQNLAVAALSDQKERLLAYTMQARFAVAQLVDHALASSTKGADDAAH